MARKLNSEEERNFIESLQTPDSAQGGTGEEAWWQKLVQKRDKPLHLTPELEEWFNKEFPSEFGF